MKAGPLALTLGDPAGIGPEIVVKAWNELRHGGPPFVVVGDAQSLASASGGGASILKPVIAPADALDAFPDALPVLDLPLRSPVVAGQPSSAAGPAIIQWIETAVGLALSGAVSGVVTAPIAKGPLYDAGFKFPGHTEFLGELTASERFEGARGPVMMLIAGDLRVALVTVHVPLAKAPGKLSIESIVNAGRVTAQALRSDFGIAQPRLAVAALNPHAGEGGAIGREEIEIVAPAVRALEDLGVDVTGPHPADTLFPEAMRARYDAVLCLYHDQALIPVKMLDFWGGVNVTLGLPIVRTSPDHGTAFDIAGRGLARADSLVAAIRLADRLAKTRAEGARAGVSPGELSQGVVDLAGLPPLREALAAHGLMAKKAFGQHFLFDLNITRKIARLAGISPGDRVIEVGPGPGGLTRALLETGALVTAIEKDQRFRPLLKDLARAAPPGALTLEFADALAADEAQLVAGGPGHVVANLPYNVGTALLIKWLTGPWTPASMTLMFQKEVAQRIVAPTDGEAYGRLAVIAQATSETHIVMDVPAKAFTPPPKVESAVVRLTPRPDRPLPARLDALQKVTAAAFGQRRKMLRASLKALGGEPLIAAAGLDPQARAETVDVAGFLRLADAWIAARRG